MKKEHRTNARFFAIVALMSILALLLSTVQLASGQTSSLRVQLRLSGSDNTSRSDFFFRVQNTGTTAQSNISVRVYFTLDGSQAASSYVLEKWYDQSGVATVSAPTLASGSTYYFTVNYGTASLAAGGSWEYQTTLHLSNWSANYSGTNDWWHTTGTLPTAYTDWTNIPLYVSGARVWGNEPGGTQATNTPTPTGPGPTNTPTPTTPPGGNNTGWVSPSNQASQTGGDGNGFQTSPTGAFADGGTAIATDTNSGTNTNTSCANTGKDRHAYFAYPLSIPGGSTITGIEVRLDARVDSATGTRQMCVEVSWNNGATWTAVKTTAALSTTEASYILGSAADTWGRAWTTGELTSANFRVRITNVSNSTSRDFFLDWAPVRVTYTGGGGVTNTPTPTPTGVTQTPTPTPTGPTPTSGPHLENPFVGATFYRNVDYVAAVNAAADLQGGTLGARMRQVANFPTFVWLDSIDAVNGTNGYPRSLVGHLDAALAQGANAIGIVVYDLPNRDCSALASNGELLIAQNGLNRYRTEYIDVIFNAISQPRFSNLRIVAIIEPDSLPNLITNLSFAKCSEAQSTGAYVTGVQYAISRIRALSNTYAYIDVAHAAWLGWPSNFGPFVTLLKQVGAGITGGPSRVDGFISNTANYNVFDEPYMDANTMVSGQPVRSLAGWYDFNDYIDEQPYATALRTALTTGSDAYPTSIGMLIDTSRNGWGGSNRPTGPSTSTDLRTFVLATTIDKRIHKGNWCNQNGAGIGARPVANPAAGFDAYVWVKPPGESDGSSSLIPQGPDNPGNKGFDRMCDPTYTGNTLNGNNMTGALPNAPVSGRWFQAQFVQLVQNAFPAFP
ncbi:MAG TPA: glycoside hydrolase family 6 protein [Anaerolineae bacterium]|nr:glycoside hydrolase family 6 protein [Anaerolineae bacterium]